MNAIVGTPAKENLSQSVNDLVAAGGHALVTDDDNIARQHQVGDRLTIRPLQRLDETEHRLMSRLGIALENGTYCVGATKYERLSDAIAYAQLKRQLPV